MKDFCSSYTKYKAIRQPRCGCWGCWKKFFETHMPLVSTAAQAPLKLVTAVRGKKFVKFFKLFMQSIGYKEPQSVTS